MTPSFLALLRQHVSAEAYRQLAPDDLWAKFRDALDETAFRVLLERIGSRVYQRCRAILRDDHLAEEAFQQTFLDLTRRRADIPGYRQAAAWAYQAATNHARHLRRTRWRQVRRESLAVAPEAGDAARADAEEVVARLLAVLPDRYRRPLELVFWDGLTHAEAAAVLGWSKGTVDSYVARGLKRLQAEAAKLGLPAAGGVALAATLARPAAALSEVVVANALRRVGLEGGPAVSVAAWWLHGWKKMVSAAAVGLMAAAGVLVGTAGRGLDPIPGPPPPAEVAAAPVETLQAKNRRILHAEVLPQVLAEFQKMLPPDNPISVAEVWSWGSEVQVEFRPVRPVPGVIPSRLQIRYCILRDRLATRYYAERLGDWWYSDPENPPYLFSVCLPLGIQLEVPLFRDGWPAIRQAFRRLPPDPRAEQEMVAAVFGPGGFSGSEFTVPAGCRGVAGNGRELFVAAQNKGFVRRAAGGWRFWGPTYDTILAADHANVYDVFQGGVGRRRIDAPAEADTMRLTRWAPGKQRLHSLAVAGGRVMTAGARPGEWWSRPLSDPDAEWDRHATPHHFRCMTASGGTIFAGTDAELFARPAGAEGRDWEPIGRIPAGTARLAVWGDRLIAVPKDPGPIHGRPLTDGSAAEWEVVGRVHVPDEAP